MGALIGACPQFPRESSSSGLPLVLKPVQVRLLQENNLIVLTKESSSANYLTDPHNTAVAANQQEAEREEMARHMRAERVHQIELNLDRIVAGRLAKLGKQLSAPELAHFRSTLKDELVSAPVCSDRASGGPVRLPVPSPFTSDAVPFSLPALDLRGDALRYFTLRHFWSKGYFVTDALKFAADFLVYDGDPIQFHSKFVVFCCDPPSARGHFVEVLAQAYGRMGKNVRKNIVVTSFATDHDHTLRLEHVQWTNQH